MKNRNFLKNSIAGLLPVALALGVLFGVSNKESNEVGAYSGASLPTTIKLNDPDESIIRNYYADLNSLSEGERKGNNLLKNLKNILSDGQKYYNYDSGDLVWKMYEITDRDWNLSPASSTTYGSYNPTTNTISNYVYGSNSNGKNNPYIRAYYMDRNQTNVVKAWGNHDQNGTGINREHLWAKAEGFDGSGAAGARGDPMHLVAANGYANNIHSNHFYGYVDKTKSYEDVKNKFPTLGHNYSGYSKTFPNSNVTVFEPQDCDKGDIARAIFYMAARYNNIAGKTASQETFDADNPNLLLTNDLSKWKSSGYTSSASNPGYHGLLSDLLEWNRIDKPDAYEIHRNNLLYTNFTNNRNPFIDFPDWADYIWGDQSAPASPDTDFLNGGNQTISVTSVEITKKPSKLVYTSGDTLDLTGMTVIANKSDGTSETLTSTQYSVTPNRALKTSDKLVTISYEGKSDSFAISVKSASGQLEDLALSFSFESRPNGWPSGSSDTENTQVYTIDSEDYSFDLGKNVYYNTSKYLMLKSTTYLGLPAIDGYKLTKVVVGNSSNCSTSTKVGISSNNSGTINYLAGGEAKTFANKESSYTYTLTNTVKDKEYYLYITSANCQIISLDLTYVPASESTVKVTEITLDPSTITAEVGQSFKIGTTVSPDNASVKLVSWESSDDSVATVNDDGLVTAVGAGNATITCSALDDSLVTATCTITVNPPITLQSLSLSGNYATEFYLNDEFSNNGMTVTANYSDGSHIDVSDEAECSGYDGSSIGNQTITVSYGGVTTTYSITVKETALADNQKLFIAAQQGVGNGENLTSYTDDPITISFSKNTSSTFPKYYSSTQSFRIYWGNSFTVSGTKKITKIEMEMASSDSVGSNTISASAGTLTGNTWTGNENVVTFSVAGTSGQRNIVSIKVTFDENSQEIATLSSISLSGTYKTEFFKNEAFSSTGLIVTAHYSDETEAVVIPTSISSPTMSSIGTKTVTVSYTENSITKSTSYNISVVAVVATSIELTGNYQTEFTQGDEFSTSGMTVVEHFNNGTTSNHYPSSCTISEPDMDTVGQQTVTVTYGANSTTYEINIKSNGKIVTQKSVSLNIGEYANAHEWENDKQYSTINANSDITITALKTTATGSNTGKYYTSGSNWRLYQTEGAELTITAPDNGKIKTVIVTYSISNTGILTFDESNITSGTEVTINAKSCVFGVGNTGSALNGQVRISNIYISYELTVDPTVKTLSSISLGGDYKTSFTVGDAFSFGGVVTATYSDETTEDVTSSSSFSGYDMENSGAQIVTVTYGEKAATYTINVKDPQNNSYTLSGGKFFEGTYLIGSLSGENTYNFMKAEIVSSRFSYSSLTISNGNNVSTTDPLLAWKIEKDGDYYTLFNEKTEMYAASTGTKNQGKLQETIDDKARWELTTVESADEYIFVNKYNSGNSVNAVLKNNGSSGFATYASTGNNFPNLSLFRLDNTSFVKVSNPQQIVNGSTLTLTGIRDNKVFGLSNITNDAVISCNEVDWMASGYYGYQNDEAVSLTVETVGDNFALKTKENKYIYSKSTSSNIFLSDTRTDAQLFTLEVSDTKVSLKCLGNNRYLGFNYNSGNPRFGFYANTTYSPYTNIYVDRNSGEANAWSVEFLEGTQNCAITDWNNYESMFGDLAVYSKNMVKDAVANQLGSLTEQAAARYDYIVSDSRYDVNPFIEDRGVTPTNKTSLITFSNIDAPSLILIILAATGVSALGLYFFYKRRREQE